MLTQFLTWQSEGAGRFKRLGDWLQLLYRPDHWRAAELVASYLISLYSWGEEFDEISIQFLRVFPGCYLLHTDDSILISSKEDTQLELTFPLRIQVIRFNIHLYYELSLDRHPPPTDLALNAAPRANRLSLIWTASRKYLNVLVNSSRITHWVKLYVIENCRNSIASRDRVANCLSR